MQHEESEDLKQVMFDAFLVLLIALVAIASAILLVEFIW